jgi:membrane-bound serine protease (ClpP class)
MKHLVAAVLVVVGFGGFLAIQTLPADAASGPHAALITIDDTIHPISASFLSRAIDSASGDGAHLIIVGLDTPGGLFSSTRDMVEDILNADIPVVVYVSPPGARAASAGTFITAAAHVAAMAPTTNIGAASPVASSGEDLPDTLASKATQDAAAFMRGIAERRGRNIKALEETVLSARSFSASEALEENLIDLIAKDVDDLMAKLDGRAVHVKDREVLLETDDLDVRTINRSPVERFLGFVANPDIAFLLLTIGGIGILVEVISPGLLGPGIIGVIALALAFVALGSLPVNWAGVGLIALAMGLFFMEVQAPGVSVFGISGAVAFVLGAFLLFGGFSPQPIPTPSFRVSLWVIAAVSATLFGSLALLIRTIVGAGKAGYVSPTSSPVGQSGMTTTPLDPRGTVQISSERWSAISDSGEPIPEGEEVIVLEVEGLTLKVFKASEGIQQ